MNDLQNSLDPAENFVSCTDKYKLNHKIINPSIFKKVKISWDSLELYKNVHLLLQRKCVPHLQVEVEHFWPTKSLKSFLCGDLSGQI
jgi:hypothetical protein